MKYLKRNRRANVSFLPVNPAFIAGLLVLVCFMLLGGEVALADNTPSATPTGKTPVQPNGQVKPGSTVAPTVTPRKTSENQAPQSCPLQPGAKPEGLVGNVNVRYDGDPATGLGYINNTGSCVWVVYLASYTVAHPDTNEGQGLYDSTSVTVYPGQRLTMQIKVPAQCRMQLDLVADKVVDLSNINYPIYHNNGSFIAGMQAGGNTFCASTSTGLLSGSTPTPTPVPPTATPTPVLPTATATAAPTSTSAPTATTVAPTNTPAPTATAIPVTTAVPATTAAPVARTTVAAAPATTPPAAVTTSAPVSTAATPATSAPAAVEGVSVTRPPETSAPSAVEGATYNGPSTNQVEAPSALAHAGEGGQTTQASQTGMNWWAVLVFAALAGFSYVGLRLVMRRGWKR